MKNFHSCLIYFFLFFGLLLFRAQSQQDAPASSAETPQYFLQILNGISSGPVDIEIDGKVLFPSMETGQRISAFGLSKKKIDFALVDKTSGNKKKVPLEFSNPGNFTLILGGDFKPFEVAAGNGSDQEQDFRVVASMSNNGSRSSGGGVRVRVVNGMTEKSVSIKDPGGRVLTIAPLQTEEISGLPSDLMLQASSENTKNRNLYLSQDNPPKNIAVVFFPAGENFGFKAMTEVTPEGTLADQKKAELAEKEEAIQATKSE